MMQEKRSEQNKNEKYDITASIYPCVWGMHYKTVDEKLQNIIFPIVPISELQHRCPNIINIFV